MNVKRLVTGLALSMLLSSGAANADWGDVYYCQMTENLEVSLEGKRKEYILGKFQFKLDKTKKAMVFGKSGKFKNVVMELREGFNWPSLESWYAEDIFSESYFDEGKFLYSHTSRQGITSVSADCDSFYMK